MAYFTNSGRSAWPMYEFGINLGQLGAYSVCTTLAQLCPNCGYRRPRVVLKTVIQLVSARSSSMGRRWVG
jgi:hypothetical protein